MASALDKGSGVALATDEVHLSFKSVISVDI